MPERNKARAPNGQFATQSFEAIYDALDREVKRIDQLRQADQDGVKAALQTSKEAVNKAEDNQRRVNEGQNEFRQALKDQTAGFMPRSEIEGQFAFLRKDINDLTKSRDQNVGKRQELAASTATILAVAAIVGGAVSTVINLLLR